MHPLATFSEPIQAWFKRSFGEPTRAQELGWPVIKSGNSTLLLAPTGSGKTLAAFLAGLDQLMTSAPISGVRLLYVSPLKALAVDIERNLRGPIEGIRASAAELGCSMRVPEIAIRTGDTPSRERAQFLRRGADLLITTPESLYLLLTSRAAQHLAQVETVIIDEIHALLPTKRGAHLFLSLERLEALRRSARPLQRIGLSATQRPLDEAARLLGGNTIGVDGCAIPRPVEVVDARMPPRLDVEVRAADPDLARAMVAPNAAIPPTVERSVWPAIHAPLLGLIREHRTTLVFVNSRRLAERLAQALNDLAGSELALAHHGSLAKERRVQIESRLKRGELPALIATSSLELGIDMGAIDLVVHVEAPPSVASGLQRIGRAGHHVGDRSKGVIIPKHKGDLMAAAAVAQAMRSAEVERIRYPRNPLDVLAQQIVAIVVTSPLAVDELYALCRAAAPFADLPRSAFEGTLDLLSGRYPSDEFAELRPRITWDRVAGRVSARAGALRVATTNVGTIADRGLYTVYLANSDRPVRIGELDEEMVFESRVGDVFLLGASSWRIDEITHDRVLVTPAPGEPGRMPFWKGDGPGRSAELGQRIGRLAHELSKLDQKDADSQVEESLGVDAGAAQALLEYTREQRAATGAVPSDRVIVVERFKDDLGDYRVCLLSPWGRRVHVPWAIALTERFRSETGTEIDAVCTDDGIVLRLPEASEHPVLAQFLFEPEEVQAWLVRGLAKSSFFAAHFRENAGRALLLPRRDPRRRQPLWAQRRRSAELLRVASQYPSFPIVLETYRECMRDVFDLDSLVDLFAAIRRREVDVVMIESARPSPFASTILFSYIGNFLYEGDAPLAERRAQALVLDQAELRTLLGEAELRELLDPEVIASTELELRRLNLSIRHEDDLHDLLLLLGDLSRNELVERMRDPVQLDSMLAHLQASSRVVAGQIAGELRYVAAEDAGKLRDALGVSLPPGIPDPLLAPVPNALEQVIARFARTHGPFASAEPAERFGLSLSAVEPTLRGLEQLGRVVRGEFLPRSTGVEWCDKNVLVRLKQRSLAKLRRAIEPAPPEAFVRLLAQWQGTLSPSPSPDALERALDQLQGLPIVASVLLEQVLPARVKGFSPAQLDELIAMGEVCWVGIEPYGSTDGRIALYRTDQLDALLQPATPVAGSLAAAIRELLGAGGAYFFHDMQRRIGGFPPELLTVLWEMVWAGEVTNDTLLPLRVLLSARQQGTRNRPHQPARSPSPRLPGSEGRWSLVRRESVLTATEQRTARALALLNRYGMVCREVVNADALGSFAELYPVFRAMEEAGKLRRGYFVQGLGGAQFAKAGADELLRAPPTLGPCQMLAATDPANPYGSILPWPNLEPRPQRVPGSLVLLQDGRLLAVLAKSERVLHLALPPDEPDRARDLEIVLRGMRSLLGKRQRRMLTIETINGVQPQNSEYRTAFLAAGFTSSAAGLCLRATPPTGDDPEQDME